MSDPTPLQEMLLELPNDLREEVLQAVADTGVSVDLLARIYRRGFNAKIGGTEEFPYGKLNPSDQGELSVAVAADPTHGVIKLVFGKPIAWLALPAAHARQMARVLVDFANQLDAAKN